MAPKLIYKLLAYKFYIVLFILAINKPIQAQLPDKYCIQANSTLQAIEKTHYNPILPDNKWSQEVFRIFIELLDPQGMLFTQSDYNYLSKYRDSIDNYVMECQGVLLSQITGLYKQRLIDADTLISVLTDKTFDFSENDTLTYYSDSIIYAKNTKELHQRWKKFLKYRTLAYLFSSEGHNSGLQKIMNKESEARKITKRKQKQRMLRLLSPPAGFENQVAEQFYNAIAQSFDPHTSYFTGTEKTNFESELSASPFSYGFEVEETENGDITIVRLVPGGPAWKSNELHKGDILTHVKWPETATYDLTLMDGYEVENLFESATASKIDLTVRKANGQVKTVSLTKEKISTDENTIKSVVLKGKYDIGYISLPDFYTEWDNNDPSGCSTDMAKEILKLRKDNIDGIIIDLRFNGGGSMGEAISLAGIFINEGPLCILKNRSDKPIVVKDLNRGTIYDGPLLLLVNGYSASASEILAGCLQDYHRAIIAGSRTYGKATSQIIVPVEHSPENDSQPEGFVKVTSGKIYRITGKSHQRKGITPDVVLPEYLESGEHESDSKNALISDSVSIKANFNPLPVIPIQALASQSKTRIANNSAFKQIQKFNDSIGTSFRKREQIPLNWNEFRNNEWKYYQAAKVLDSLVRRKPGIYKVTNNNHDKQIIDLDPYKSETNALLIKNVENDIYIEECYRILNDFINFKQTK
jgi:carboxyl-terminal processing protease